MKLFNQLLTSVTTCLLAATSAQASAVLTYEASQYQCDTDSSMVEITIDVYDNDELVAENMSIGDSVLVSDIDNVVLSYSTSGVGCFLDTPTELIVRQESEVPSLSGAYSQESIVELLAELEEYEELFLVELGTTDTTSFAYDLQDAVLRLNNNPSPEDIATISNNSDDSEILVFAD